MATSLIDLILSLILFPTFIFDTLFARVFEVIFVNILGVGM